MADEPLIPELAAALAGSPPEEKPFDVPELNAAAVGSGFFTRPQTITQAALSARMPWEDVAPHLERATGTPPPPELEQAYTSEVKLASARDRFKGAVETPEAFALRRMVPFGSAVVGLKEQQWYKAASDRIQQGTATDDDYNTVAGHERLQEIEKGRSLEGTAGAALAHVPAILGEGWVAGKAIGGAGRLLGLGGKAAPLVEGAALKEASNLAKFGGYMARVAPTTALMPSMYLAEAGKRAAEQGGDWTDAKNFAPAFAMGYANTAVLGSLQKFVNDGGVVRQVVGKTAVGLGEQAGVDVGAQAISDAFLSKAYKIDTGYGVLGDLVKEAKGQKSDLAKHLVSQAAVFGTFSAIHVGKAWNSGTLTRGDRMNKAVEAALKDLADKGEPFDRAGAAVGHEAEAVNAAILAGKDRAWFDERLDALGADYPANLRKMWETARDSVGATPKNAGVEPAETVTGRQPEPTDLPTTRPAATPAPEPVAESGRQDSRPTDRPVTDQLPVTPPDPLAVLGEGVIRSFAPAFSLRKNAKIDTILSHIEKSPSSAARLRNLVDAKVRETTRPEAPPAEQTAPEVPETTRGVPADYESRPGAWKDHYLEARAAGLAAPEAIRKADAAFDQPAAPLIKKLLAGSGLGEGIGEPGDRVVAAHGRELLLRLHPETNVLSMDFRTAGTPGDDTSSRVDATSVPKGMRPGTPAFLRSLQAVLRAAAREGVAIDFGSIEARRGTIYRKAFEQAGFKITPGERGRMLATPETAPEGPRAGEVVPGVETPAAAPGRPVETKVGAKPAQPEWVAEQVARGYGQAERGGVVGKILDLAAEHLTRKEIVTRMKDDWTRMGIASGDESLVVNAVRSRHNVPSMDEKAAYVAWRDSYLMSKTPAVGKSAGLRARQGLRVADLTPPRVEPTGGRTRPSDEAIAEFLRKDVGFVRDPANRTFVEDYAIPEMGKKAPPVPPVTGLRKVDLPDRVGDHYDLMAGDRAVGRLQVHPPSATGSPDTIRIEWVGLEGANTANARKFHGALGAKNVVAILTEVAKQYPEARAITGRRVSGFRDEAGRNDQEVRYDITRDGGRVRVRNVRALQRAGERPPPTPKNEGVDTSAPSAPKRTLPPGLTPEEKKAWLEANPPTPPARGAARTREQLADFASGMKAKGPTRAPEPVSVPRSADRVEQVYPGEKELTPRELAEISVGKLAKAVAEYGDEPLGASDLRTLRDLADDPEAMAKLAPDEAAVVRGRAAGLTQEATAATPEMMALRKAGSAPLGRARVQQIEKAALAKLGETLSGAQIEKILTGEREQLIRNRSGTFEKPTDEAGKPVKMMDPTAAAKGVEQLAEDWWGRTIEDYKDILSHPEAADIIARIQARIEQGTGMSPAEQAGLKAALESVRRHPRIEAEVVPVERKVRSGRAVPESEVTDHARRVAAIGEQDARRSPEAQVQVDAEPGPAAPAARPGEGGAEPAPAAAPAAGAGALKRTPPEWTPSGEEIPYSSAGRTRPPTPKNEGVGTTTPAQVIAEQDAAFGRVTGAHNYGHEPRTPSGHEAEARLREKATVTAKSAANDPLVNLEENAHHVTEKFHFHLNPASAPPDVVEGFRQFNRVWGVNVPPGHVEMIEGYASWLKSRTLGEEMDTTPAMIAADKYAEEWSASRKLGTKNAGLTALFDKAKAWHAALPTSAEGRAQALGSATGKNPTPERSAQAVADTLLKRWTDEIDNAQASIQRLEATVNAARKEKGRGPLPPDATNTWSVMHYASKALAGVFEAEGVRTLKDGRWVGVEGGLPLKAILAGADPKWVEAGPGGAASRAGTYALARHVVGEYDRAGKARDAGAEKLRLARDSGDADATAAAQKEYRRILADTQSGLDLVPKDQLDDYRSALKAAEADPAFAAWAKPFAEKLTRAFDATRLALESPDIHMLPPGTTAELSARRPDYVPTDRVRGEAGWNQSTPGAKGEKAGQVLRGRTGSGESIVDPLLSYKRRLLVTAHLVEQQILLNAVAKFKGQPGAGAFIEFFDREGGGKTPLGELRAEQLREHGVDPDSVKDILRSMGLERAESYFSSTPWPTDGSKPTKEWIGPGGKPTSMRIGDRSLYELVTNQQVDAHQAAKVVNGLANMKVFGVKPVAAAAQVVRTGATGASVAFQLRNILRDAFEFWKNTTDRSTLKQLPGEWWKTYGRMWRVFSHNFAEWYEGKAWEKKPEDGLFRQFYEMRGDQYKQLAFERDNPDAAWNGIKTSHSVWGLAKDFMNFLGAAELAPRFLEFKTRLTKVTGKTAAQLNAEFDAADRAAREGKLYENPVPFHMLIDAMQFGKEVTVPFDRQGVLTREINKITPFFGPAVAGLSKAVRNWKTNAKGAAFGLAAVGVLRALHWAMFRDEKWYKELAPHDRFNNFVVPTPVGLRRLPGPRDLDLAFGGAVVTSLDAAAGQHPDFAGLLNQSLEANLPPGVGRPAASLAKGDVGGALGEAAVAPFGPAATTGLDMIRNKDWTGKPIVPRRDEKTPGWDQFVDHYGPYALKQLTGGRGELSLTGSGLNILPEVKNLSRSVTELHERYHELEVERVAAERRGERFRGAAEFQRLGAARQQIGELAAKARGESKAGGKTVRGEKPADEVRKALQERETEIARRALGK